MNKKELDNAGEHPAEAQKQPLRDPETQISPRDVDDYEAGRNSRWFLAGLYVGVSLLFIGVFIEGARDHRINFFSSIYLTIPFFGALFGFSRLRRVRQAILDSPRLVPTLFCAGLLSWSLGCVIWMYYNFKLHEEVPYPSWADVGYFLHLLIWTLGIFFLYKFLGASLLRNFSAVVACLGVAWGVTLPIMLWAHGGTLSIYSPARELFKFMLDISYPIGDAFNLALLVTLLLSPTFKKLNTKMRKALFFIVPGYLLIFFGDLSFNVITSVPKNSPLAYYNGGPTDFMFATAFFVLSIGISHMPLAQTSWTKAGDA